MRENGKKKRELRKEKIVKFVMLFGLQEKVEKENGNCRFCCLFQEK